MLVGGDLGFRSLVVLVLAFLGPVIGFFVVRRKWRLAIARREEVKRLLVLASEEAARAELEATAGSGYGNDDYIYEYASPAPAPKSNSRPVQYECAVCFSPTATRCARCKSIRYCSGKCQIIHWRQGHKEECRPFTFANQTNDVEGGSDLKVSKPEKHEASVVAFGIEERPFAKPVGDFSDSVCSGSDHPEVLLAKAGKGVKCFTDGIGTTATSDTAPSLPGECTSSAMAVESSVDCPNTFETPNGYQSDNVPSDKRETNFSIKPQIRTSVSAQPTLVNSVLGCTSSDKLDENRPSSCGDRRTQHLLASSSGRSSDGSDESSLSEPSTPCSDFWEGATKSSKSRIVADDARSSSSETRAVNTSDGIPSTNSSFDLANNVNSRAEVHCPNMKATSDNVCPGKSVFKKPSSSSGSSRETGKNCSRSGRSPSYSSDMFDHNNIATINNSHMSKSRDVEYCSSASNSHPALSNEGRATKKDASKISSLPFLCPERPNLADNDSHALKSKGAGHLPPKAADVNLSSTNGRHSVQSNQSVKVDYAPGPDACSTTQFEGYSQNNKNGLKTSMLKVVDQIRATKLSRHYPSVAGNEMAGSYNKKGLFSYELFVKLYNSNKVDMRPCGLINCGNSCYANAVLQCLAFTPPLTAYLLQGFHSKACEKRDWCFSCEFESLLLKVKEGISPLTPIRILSQIQSIGSHLGHGREEDAHEFLRYAVDTMQADCLKEVGVKASGSFEEETTLIGLTFGGYLRSKIRCMRCGGKSERHERMMDLTVEIGGDIGTLEEALRQFTGTEILDGENKYQCSRCKSYERAKKKLTVLEAPNILTIALKRFQSGKFGKLNKSIRFPEILNLAPFMSGTSDKSPVYRLYGVVVHLDIMNAAFSGHYVCYVKNIQNKWFKIDDSTVKAVELEKVLEKGAYMLLYARCSPRAPKFIRNSIITHDLRKPKSRYHPTNPWDFSKADILNRHMTGESIQTILEEDSSSDHSSSLFSEAGSCSTESSNRDSTSNEDYFDQILGDFGQIWRNSSDSDTSSSSSSPSPLYTTRHSPLADLDRYAANCEMEKKASVMNHDSTNKLNRKLVNSSSCRERERERERDSGRLGRSNPFEEGEVESLRRSTRD